MNSLPVLILLVCQPIKQAKSGIVKRNTKLAPTVDPQVQEDTKAKITEDKAKGRTDDSQEIRSTLPGKVEETFKIQPSKSTSTQENNVADVMIVMRTSSTYSRLGSPSQKGSCSVSTCSPGQNR